MDVNGGPLGLLSTKADWWDVRIHPNRRWNDRRASGTGLKPPTPTAGSRTRPRAAFRALSVLS